MILFSCSYQHGQTALDIAVRNRNNQALKKLLKYDCSEEILEEVKKKRRTGGVEFYWEPPGEVPSTY